MRILLFLLPFLYLSTAYAQCYTQDEANAERLLRIHSELMVIGLNCQHRNGNSYNDYKIFTNKHASLIGHYEDVMQNYFVRTGRAQPEKTFHEFRTGLANRIARDAAVRPDGFCSTYLSRMKLAQSLSQSQIRQWMASYPTSQPLCGQ